MMISVVIESPPSTGSWQASLMAEEQQKSRKSSAGRDRGAEKKTPAPANRSTVMGTAATTNLPTWRFFSARADNQKVLAVPFDFKKDRVTRPQSAEKIPE